MTRRTRRGRGLPSVPLLILIAAVVLLLAVRVLPVLLLVAVGAGGGYAAGRLRRPPASRPHIGPAAGRAAPRPSVSRGDNRARRNGWLPPARPATVTLALTPECAAYEHAVCPGGSCECPCGHEARVIVAMHTARQSLPDEPPF